MLGLLVGLSLLVTGQPVSADIPLQTAVLIEKLPGVDPDALADVGFSRTVAVDEIGVLDARTVLVLPECRAFPAQGMPLIEAFLNRGGHLLAVGGPAFEELLYRAPDGAWTTESALLSQVPASHQLVDWERLDFSALERNTSQPDALVSYRQAPDGVLVEMDLLGQGGWETVGLTCHFPPPPEHNLLQFRAMGYGKATRLLVEAREKDGSRWMATIPLTRREKVVGLHQDRFAFWHDSWSQGRGGEGDHVRFDNVAAFVFGFAASHFPLSEGSYGFAIRQMATAETDVKTTRPDILRLEGLCPPYKTFSTEPARYEALDWLRGSDTGAPKQVVSPVARPMRPHPDREYTWQPLLKGYDREGQWCATPISTTWHRSGATWTFVGYRLDPALLAVLAQRLACAIPEGLPVEDECAPLLAAEESGPCVGVRDGHFVLNGQRWFAHGINYWPLYVSGMEPLGYFSHWLEPRFYIPELIDLDLATLHEMGDNLVSIQYGRESQARQLRDFAARCGRFGIKVNVFVHGAHPTGPADDDLSQRPFVALLRAADLAGNPHVLGYDLAWEPKLGRYEERRRLDGLFEKWVVAQYGSMEHAEALWEFPAERRDGCPTGPTDEQLTHDGPHRVMVAAYRRFVDDLVSRRYREVIRIARTIDNTHLFGARTGYGGTGTMGGVPVMQFQLTSGAAHLDFLSPEGWGYGPRNMADAALVTQYARWAGNGKPVFWAEFGKQVWQQGERALVEQEEVYTAFADMVRRTDADGWAGWWFPGGYRVDERSDYGIVAPDRHVRPAGLVLKAFAGERPSVTPPAPSEKPILVDRDASPEGLAGVVARQSEAFAVAYWARGLPTLATHGTGTTSANCPATAVGGVPFEAPAPPAYLNAEVVVQSCDGDRIRVELINTGEATWLKTDCALEVRVADSTSQVALPADVSRFGHVVIAFYCPAGARLAMAAQRFGRFGERIVVDTTAPSDAAHE